eukprot:3760987-Amphidinium_carterae.1
MSVRLLSVADTGKNRTDPKNGALAAQGCAVDDEVEDGKGKKCRRRRRRRRSLPVLFATLFHQIPTEGYSLITALEGLSQHQSAISHVRGIRSGPVPLQRGVHQGCTGSPWLFSICMEWILASVAASLPGHGIKLDDDGEILFTSYADDVYVMTDSVEKLQHVIE